MSRREPLLRRLRLEQLERREVLSLTFVERIISGESRYLSSAGFFRLLLPHGLTASRYM